MIAQQASKSNRTCIYHAYLYYMQHLDNNTYITTFYYLHAGSVIGFTDLGKVNNQLKAFERVLSGEREGDYEVANSMLVFMVRGLFSQLQYPYVQFPCTSLCGDQMFEPFWEAVVRLERNGFRVMGLVCDGLAANRRLFTMHGGSFTYKTANPYSADNRFIYFFSDPPHLIKTVRNAWANPKRPMWLSSIIHSYVYMYISYTPCINFCFNNGKEIGWSHLVNLYHMNRPKTDTPGLAMVPKLRYEHIYLTSYSKMRVDLAAQVYNYYKFL